MNTYYSNLIEGRHTRPRDIERALSGDLDQHKKRRELQIEAKAHVRVQADLDKLFAEARLPDPTSSEFILYLHREFYRDAPESALLIKGAGREFVMEPGKWRSLPEHDVAVGQHLPPSSNRVSDFMRHFELRYCQQGQGKGSRILALPAAHHRLNYIHPFPDGNGRVSRLMSHAMAHSAGIGAHGLWSVSRGLARGLESRSEYKQMMDYADMPRQNDLDGRGNLSLHALKEFTQWFLKVCLDQVSFMSGLFEIEALAERFRKYVAQSNTLKPESSRLLEEALMRGEYDRGEAARITGLPERSARRVLNDLVVEGLLASATLKGPVSLRFPTNSLEILFPRLYVQA
jgi:Fic family protein